MKFRTKVIIAIIIALIVVVYPIIYISFPTDDEPNPLISLVGWFWVSVFVFLFACAIGYTVSKVGEWIFTNNKTD